MRHLSIVQYGTFLSLSGERLVIKNGDSLIRELPLSRLKTISIMNRGVSFTSNLIGNLAMRGIRFFIIDFRNRHIAALSGTHRNAVVELRKKQMEALDQRSGAEVAREIVYGKVRNQRAVLLYFSKYHSESADTNTERLKLTASQLRLAAKKVQQLDLSSPTWRSELMGHEGNAAAEYWKSLRESHIFPPEFSGRTGRGAQDVINKALNLGYSVLESYVWNALGNTGLEIYAGFLHTDRPGKPSLVIDFMEEYRAWVVDRAIIKKKNLLIKEGDITLRVKKEIIEEIHRTFQRKYHYKNKKMKLETILQKQAYRISAALYDKIYKAYLFRW